MKQEYDCRQMRSLPGQLPRRAIVHQVAASISLETKAALEILCERERMSAAYFVRKALQELLDGHGLKAPSAIRGIRRRR